MFFFRFVAVTAFEFAFAFSFSWPAACAFTCSFAFGFPFEIAFEPTFHMHFSDENKPETELNGGKNDRNWVEPASIGPVRPKTGRICKRCRPQAGP